MSRVVIVHHEHGIYVGHAMGFAFWSNLDAVDQPSVAGFDDVADAQGHVAEWDGEHDASSLTYHEVEAANAYVTVDELRAAGLEEHLGELVATHHSYGIH